MKLLSSDREDEEAVTISALHITTIVAGLFCSVRPAAAAIAAGLTLLALSIPLSAQAATPTLVQHVAGAMENNNGYGAPSIIAQLPNPTLAGNALVLCVQMDQPVASGSPSSTTRPTPGRRARLG